MKKIILYVLGFLFVIVLFSLLIYPTPYRYLEFEYDNNGGKVPVKINTITGKTETFTPMNGWTEVENHN
ncbi:hypothetical protein [Paenibacillus etheri]|uniref:Uncharacterized protein n=1 Tax=Paenibacillus etheri TaxID=1306852 RepID=A0A0W1AYC6_9BACL|nr:hypothetical protein [Paenibacillus etheri]KTD86318.1 hypothetical protein UQ64_15785 [Paenibacillus etheri]